MNCEFKSPLPANRTVPGARPLRCIAALILLFGLLLSAICAQAQSGTEVAAAPGWLASTSSMEGQDTLGWIPITPADAAAARSRLSAALDIIRRTPTGRQPQGFEALPHFQWASSIGSIIDPNASLSYTLSLRIFTPTRAIAGETSNAITVIFNPYPEELSFGLMSGSEKEWDVVRELTQVEPVHGFAAFEPNCTGYSPLVQVLLSAGGRPWYRQVTREEYLRWEIRRNQEDHGEAMETYKQALQKTPYETWMDEAQKRKEQQEQILATIAATDPVQAASLRDEMEKTEIEMTRNLKASEKQDRAQALIDSDQPTMWDIGQAKLDAMSPAERAAPAWMAPGFDSFVEGTESGAQRLVQADPAFYRKGSGPASDVRSILVQFCGVGEGRRIEEQIVRELDWDAMAALMNSPGGHVP